MAKAMGRLGRAHKIMVQIVAEREDGKRYMPIVLCLEKQITAERVADDEYQGISRLAAAKSA